MFKKAERKQVKLKMAVTGVSGSGKTYSSLLIARGLVGEKGKIAVLDTENRSASLYSHLSDFDVAEIEPPFEVDKYTKTINEAVKLKYDAIVIDSLTHSWQQLLQEKEAIDAKGGNSFTNWSRINPKYKSFLEAILQSDIHIIGTMRSKTEYAMEVNDKGKTAPKKIGLAPIQRDGMDYEFTIVLDVAHSHMAEASKDRTGLFADKVFMPSIKTGEIIREWLNGEAIPEAPKQPTKEAGNITKFMEAFDRVNSQEQIDKFMSIVELKLWTTEELEQIYTAKKQKEKTLGGE